MNGTNFAASDGRGFRVLPPWFIRLKRVRDPISPPQRDASLLEVVLAYRTDRSSSSLLLEMLLPAITLRLRAIAPQPPVISMNDVRQQLILEVLQAAATMPIPPQATLVQQRIMKRAGWCVTRWLDRELDYRDWIEPLPDDEDDEEVEE